MHRFFGRFVVGAGALLIAATAQAQATTDGRPFKLGGALGATLPLGDFGDGADLGFHFGGLIEYKPSSVPINLRGEITYHRNGLKDGFFDDFPGVDVDGNSSILGFIGNAFFPFGDPASTARPYAIGGLGVYRLGFSGDVEGSNIDLDISETKFGLNVGGGFTFNLSGFETFVEARFHSVFTEASNTNFIPLSFGFKF
jgi:opacity protein-like surface antigen